MQHGGRPLRSTRRPANLAGSRPAWYSISNTATAGAPAQVSIYDEIGFYGVSAGDFLADLKALSGADIELHLNSPGGDVFDGIAIYNTLRQSKGSVHVIVDGLAASAASFIAMAASPGKLEMAPHSQMMIHDGFAIGIGNAADMRDLADQLDRVSDEIASIYAERTGKPTDHWRSLMTAESWFSDSEAVAAGLADKIHGQEDSPAKDDWDLSVFAKYPGNALGEAYAPEPYHREADEAVECPACRKYNAPDARYCDQCGAKLVGRDDVQEAVTDSAKPDAQPDAKGAATHRFPVLAADIDTSPWDASKAWHGGTEADDPAAFYRGICAGRKAGDPSTQAAWALPYRYTPSSPANAAAVRDGLSRLPQIKGLTNHTEARSTLEKIMKQVNPEYDPDDYIDPGLLAAVLANGLLEGAER